ncbi:MAG: ribonuclease H-like YkuK family protein [Chitinophagales bacterium]|nr:ribonuclease H-like YkuK family protein [Chitinophagales bacterium]
MGWRKLDGTFLGNELPTLVEDTIVKELAKGYNLKICVGTDSQVYKNYIEFATVVVFLRQGSGGFMFINNHRHIGNMGIKERMIIEVSKSIEAAYSICEILDLYNVDLEVHADINTNPNFKSNTALSEAMGYILSMGFQFKAKPDAFASSSCADKVV